MVGVREPDRADMVVNSQNLAMHAALADIEQMDNSRTYALGFVNFARSYLQTAQCAIRQVEAGNLKITYDAPLFALLAHSLELNLKASLLLLGKPQNEVRSYEHRILHLFDSAQEIENETVSITALEKTVRARWKSYLRSSRDDYRRRISTWVGSEEESVLEEFGVFSNETIGNELPKLREQIDWLHRRHSRDGSQFRYLKKGFYQSKVITAFGLHEDVQLRTLEWACEELGEMLANHLFPNRIRPGHL